MRFAASVAPANGPLCQRRGVHYLSEALINSFAGGAISEVEKSKTVNPSPYGSVGQFSSVMKFGGSSVASAERIREVAELILSFPEEWPVIVLSAIGKTTDKLLQAGEKAVSCGVSNVSDMAELSSIKELHLVIIDELGVDRSTISALLDDLELFLKGIAMMKEMAPRSKDYLVSFGECMSTRIFAAYLNKIGAKARQYDAFDIGFITTDEFTNAEILEATYPAVAKRLHGDWIRDPAIPVVTGFLGKGWKSRAVTTLGRGGSDLTATTIGKALGLQEIQVWMDVDGVLTCDPNIYPDAEPVPYLTFGEAAELAYFNVQVLHPQSLQPAREGDIPVRVKNSCNPKAPGTLITRARDMSKSVITGIVVKQNAIILDIGSTRMLGQSGFLAKVFSIFEELGISADVVATSEVSILLNLDPSMLSGRELIQQDLDHVVEELQKIAIVNHLQHKSIISLIGNMQYSSLIIEKVLGVLRGIGVKVQMTPQGASKEKISFIVNDSKAEQCVRVLHLTFFAMGLNTADAFQNCFAESSSETTLVEGLASASHVPCSNATPSGLASTSHLPDLNSTPCRLASASNVPDSNSTPVGLASVLDSNSTPVGLASVLGSNSTPIGLACVLDNSMPIGLASVLDSDSIPSVSASASHMPNSNATPSGLASASHVQEPHTTSFEFYSNLLTGEIHTVVHSRDGKVSLGIMFGLIGLVLGWQMIRRQ